MDERLKAICDLSVPSARERAGRHEYDGVPQDLSPSGVRAGLAALGGPGYPDRHDEALALAAEHTLRVSFGELELHRSNPLWHIANLELTCYDREYAAEAERAEARRAHLAAWPDAVDAAVTALDRVPAPVAAAALPAARGLATGVHDPAALGALDRLVAHLEDAAGNGEPTAALGASALTALLSATEALDVDLTDLVTRAELERKRLRQLLDESCRRIDPDAPSERTVRALLADRPTPDQLLGETAALVAEVIAWTAEQGLVPYDDGECLVGPTPPSQPWQVAAMVPAAPGEPDTPSRFYVTLPGPEWPEQDREQWLSLYARSFLPVIAVHEVAPGHFSHGRALRRVASPVRRTWLSDAFTEGWAHYTEELALEQGFRSADPGFPVAVARDGLLRITRLICLIGLHGGDLSVADATRRFTEDAFLEGRTATRAVHRLLLDPLCGGYAWGKLAIRDLRDQARERWGAGFSLRRFHTALFDLGAPPLGLLDTALERG